MFSLKRVGSVVVALALSVSCMSGVIASAMKWSDGMTPREIFMAKLDAADDGKTAKLSDEEKEVLVDHLLEAFESGDFTGLSFYEKTAVFNDAMFTKFMEDAGLSKRQKGKLLKARTGAFDVIEVERDINYYDWLDSDEFAVFLNTTGLTEEQKAGLLNSRPVFNDSGMLNAYLRTLGLSESERDAFRDDLHKAYEEARYGGITEPVGYTSEDFMFDAFVGMMESGEFDKLLAKRGKDKKFSAEDKLAIAEMFDVFVNVDESDVYAAMRTTFDGLSAAE